MSVRVPPEWLELREPADAAARSEELAGLLARHLPAGPLEIHDLGGGSGSMGRWLAPRLAGEQRWVVHDRDDDLLALAAASGFETRHTDITGLEPEDLEGADAVVASALLDLLTAGELARILRAAAGRPMLFALSVTGRVTLDPADPLDATVAAAFNAHQRRGGLLGPDAVDRLTGIVRPSPWQLGSTALTAEWLRGWAGAAGAPGAYLERRLAQIEAGELAVTVDHADVLVLP